MKVLHVIPSVSPLRGGPSTVLRSMAAGLALAGVETHVVCTNDDGENTSQVRCGEPIVEDGVTYRYFPRQIKFYTVSMPLAMWLARSVHQYDILHIHSLFSFPTSVAAFWAGRRNRPYVLRPLGSLCQWGLERRRPLLKRASLSFLEHWIIAGAAALHYATKHEQYEAEKIQVGKLALVIADVLVIPNALTEGIVPEDTPRPLEKAGPLRVTTVCRFDPVKGLDLLLEAMAMLKRRHFEFKLILVGDGETTFVDKLKNQAARLGVANDIIWTGYLTGEKKLAVLGQSDIFVLPSHFESFGIAVVEAMRSGVPVVVSENVGLKYEITAGEAGIVVPLSAQGLARGIADLLTNPPLRERLGANARLVAKQFSIGKITPQIIDMYNAILARHPGGTPSDSVESRRDSKNAPVSAL